MSSYCEFKDMVGGCSNAVLRKQQVVCKKKSKYWGKLYKTWSVNERKSICLTVSYLPLLCKQSRLFNHIFEHDGPF